MDVHNENCEEVFQAERKEAVKPGVYRLDCAVRTEDQALVFMPMAIVLS